jgi:predicted ester cyclase
MTFLKAFPDLHMTVEDVIAEEDKVVVRWVASGRQQGPLMVIPPTGKQVNVCAIGYQHLLVKLFMVHIELGIWSRTSMGTKPGNAHFH